MVKIFKKLGKKLKKGFEKIGDDFKKLGDEFEKIGNEFEKFGNEFKDIGEMLGDLLESMDPEEIIALLIMTFTPKLSTLFFAIRVEFQVFALIYLILIFSVLPVFYIELVDFVNEIYGIYELRMNYGSGYFELVDFFLDSIIKFIEFLSDMLPPFILTTTIDIKFLIEDIRSWSPEARVKTLEKAAVTQSKPAIKERIKSLIKNTFEKIKKKIMSDNLGILRILKPAYKTYAKQNVKENYKTYAIFYTLYTLAKILDPGTAFLLIYNEFFIGKIDANIDLIFDPILELDPTKYRKIIDKASLIKNFLNELVDILKNLNEIFDLYNLVVDIVIQNIKGIEKAVLLAVEIFLKQFKPEKLPNLKREVLSKLKDISKNYIKIKDDLVKLTYGTHVFLDELIDYFKKFSKLVPKNKIYSSNDVLKLIALIFGGAVASIPKLDDIINKSMFKKPELPPDDQEAMDYFNSLNNLINLIFNMMHISIITTYQNFLILGENLYKNDKYMTLLYLKKSDFNYIDINIYLKKFIDLYNSIFNIEIEINYIEDTEGKKIEADGYLKSIKNKLTTFKENYTNMYNNEPNLNDIKKIIDLINLIPIYVSYFEEIINYKKNFEKTYISIMKGRDKIFYNSGIKSMKDIITTIFNKYYKDVKKNFDNISTNNINIIDPISLNKIDLSKYKPDDKLLNEKQSNINNYIYMYASKITNNNKNITSLPIEKLVDSLLDKKNIPSNISKQPESILIFENGNAVTSVESSISNTKYQWYRANSLDKSNNDKTIVLATTNILTINNVSLNDGGYYYCSVLNDGYAISYTNTILITVVSQPLPVNYIENGITTFKINVSNKENKYQWYFNNFMINGATNSIYSIINTQPTNKGEYYVSIKNDVGTLKSNVVKLGEFEEIVIIQQPLSQTFNTQLDNYNLSCTLNVEILEVPNELYSYEWYELNNYKLLGTEKQFNISLSINNLVLNVDKILNYYVIIKNKNKNLMKTSNIASIKIVKINSSVNFRYLKFNIVGVRGPESYLQFKDFKVYNNSTLVDYSSASARVEYPPYSYLMSSSNTDGIDNNINTGIYAFIYGGSNTNGQYSIPYFNYIIDFGKNISATNYSYVTNGDYLTDDPVSWKIYISNDGTNYNLSDEQSLASITTNRLKETQLFNLK